MCRFVHRSRLMSGSATSHSHGRNTELIKQQETQVANVPKAEFAIRILAMLCVVQNENCTVWRPSTPGQTLDSHGTRSGWRLRWLDMVSKNRCNYCPVSSVMNSDGYLLDQRELLKCSITIAFFIIRWTIVLSHDGE